MLPEMLNFLNKNLLQCLQCKPEPPLLNLGGPTVMFAHYVFESLMLPFACLNSKLKAGTMIWIWIDEVAALLKSNLAL